MDCFRLVASEKVWQAIGLLTVGIVCLCEPATVGAFPPPLPGDAVDCLLHPHPHLARRRKATEREESFVALVQGKSVAQVIAKLGPPHSVSHSHPEFEEWEYHFQDVSFRIGFKKDRAVFGLWGNGWQWSQGLRFRF